MSQHKRKITIRVTAQTAYHIKRMAQTAGKVVDSLVIAAKKGERRKR